MERGATSQGKQEGILEAGKGKEQIFPWSFQKDHGPVHTLISAQ